jgi:hypothetical protein
MHWKHTEINRRIPIWFYILEKIVRRFNCTLLYRLYDVLYVIILSIGL